MSQLDFGMLRYCRFGGVLLVTWVIRTTSPILVPKRAFLYESSGQNSSSNSAESVGGVHSQEETSHWRFNSANETDILIHQIEKAYLADKFAVAYF